MFQFLPYFEWAFIDPLRDVGIEFQSDVHITHITCPITILHAEDDHVIPIQLARKVCKYSTTSGFLKYLSHEWTLSQHYIQTAYT